MDRIVRLMYGLEAFGKGLEWIMKPTCNIALLERSGHTTVLGRRK